MSSLVLAVGLAPVVCTAQTATELLRSATQDFSRSDWTHASNEFRALLRDPKFDELTEADRHIALNQAAQTALQLKDPAYAHGVATRATDLPEATADDWNMRFAAALRIDDGRDQAFCVTNIVRRWGLSDPYLSSSVVLTAFNTSDRSDASDAQFDMLNALYDRRWKSDSGASRLWLTFARLLLERGDQDRATQVAVLIDAPDDIIVLNADRRFKPLLKSRFVKTDPEAMAHERLKHLQEVSRTQPRSLFAFRNMLNAMAELRMDNQTLTLVSDIERRIQSSPGDFDDAAQNYSWILDLKSHVLHRLGRFEEAVMEMDRAAHLPDRRDLVSQPLNLASLLADLGRPDDALAALPPTDELSLTGRTVLSFIRVTVAVQKNDSQQLESALTFLRQHRDTHPTALEHALARAGAQEEARQVLLWRLNDSASRSGALQEMQHYTEPARTSAEAHWHEAYVALNNDLEVKSLVAKLGNVDRYSWRYNTFN